MHPKKEIIVNTNNRDYSLDLFKAMLVIGMVWVHCWQFMHSVDNKLEGYLSMFVNIISFSSFMFAFGRASQLASFSKPKEKVKEKLIINFFTLITVYYISGFGAHFLVEEHQSLYSCLKILLLWKVPGYSEFLLSFAILMLMVLAFFEKIINISSSRRLTIIAVLFSLACSFLPYQYIKIPFLGIFVGTQKLAGVYLQRLGMKIKWEYILFSAIISSVGLIYNLVEHKFGDRFPPSIFWLVLAWFPIMCYTLISNRLQWGICQTNRAAHFTIPLGI